MVTVQLCLAFSVGTVGWSSGPHAYTALIPAMSTPQPHNSNVDHFQVCDTESSCAL